MTPEEGDKGDDLESLAGGFSWRREGGIAGFCDIVTVTVGDVAVVSTCRPDPPDALGHVTLSGEQMDQLSEMVARLDSFEYEKKDPATADAMTITITFTGVGDEEAADADVEAINNLASEILRGDPQLTE